MIETKSLIFFPLAVLLSFALPKITWRLQYCENCFMRCKTFCVSKWFFNAKSCKRWNLALELMVFVKLFGKFWVASIIYSLNFRWNLNNCILEKENHRTCFKLWEYCLYIWLYLVFLWNLKRGLPVATGVLWHFRFKHEVPTGCLASCMGTRKTGLFMLNWELLSMSSSTDLTAVTLHMLIQFNLGNHPRLK